MQEKYFAPHEAFGSERTSRILSQITRLQKHVVLQYRCTQTVNQLLLMTSAFHQHRNADRAWFRTSLLSIIATLGALCGCSSVDR